MLHWMVSQNWNLVCLVDDFMGQPVCKPKPVRILDQAQADMCVVFGLGVEITLWHNYSSSILLLDIILPEAASQVSLLFFLVV